MARISLTSASLRFPLISDGARSLRSVLAALAWRKQLDVEMRHIQALSEITLSLTDGDRLGLIGPNGAGKSTLLRLMAGIFEPSSGQVQRDGKTVGIFDLSFGMDEEASGKENIAIAGTMLGLAQSELAAVREEIAAFSELGTALERAIKTYSAGMRVRLAFGLATSLRAEVLLIDEIIGVGDAMFMKKASARLASQADNAKITVLASHAESVLRDFCTTGLVLIDGQVRFLGPLEAALDFYKKRYA